MLERLLLLVPLLLPEELEELGLGLFGCLNCAMAPVVTRSIESMKMKVLSLSIFLGVVVF